MPLLRWMIAVCLLCLGVAAGAASEPNWGTWAEEVRKQHPLAGSIYRTARQPVTLFGNSQVDVQTDVTPSGVLHRPLPPKGRGPALLAQFGPLHQNSRIILLGEVHDNRAHHQLRAWMIETSAKLLRPWRPAIVFEQIRADQQPALDDFKALMEAGSATADELFGLLEWDKSGWPQAQLYEPLFEAALAAKLPIYAGDPPRGQVRAVARGGLASLLPEERARLLLDEPMPGPLLKALREELAGSHCGLLSAEAVEGMAAAQRYRDAHLADALLSAAERHGSAILIAGNGHVRKDRGVPWHLRQRVTDLGLQTAAFMFIEVEEGKTDPELYVPRDPEGKPAADLLILAPRAQREDPCEGMRRMKRQ